MSLKENASPESSVQNAKRRTGENATQSDWPRECSPRPDPDAIEEITRAIAAENKPTKMNPRNREALAHREAGISINGHRSLADCRYSLAAAQVMRIGRSHRIAALIKERKNPPPASNALAQY
jgi:hypothetical protein